MNKLNTWLVVIVAILALLVGILWTNNVNMQRSNNNWKHNYEVLQDSVEVIKTKNGELLFENGSLIIEKNELQEALDLSKEQIKDYEKALGSSLAYITKLESQLEIKDTIRITNIIHDTLTNSYSMHYQDEWLRFDELFSLKSPTSPTMDVFNIHMNVPITVGIGDNYNIIVTSPNPYFEVSSIDGAVIDGEQFAKRLSRWTFGAYAGFGLNYDLIHNTMGVGPQVGVGIGFRFF